MADERNVQHLKHAGRVDDAAALTGPAKKKRGRGGPRGHMAIGREPVSDHVVKGLPRRRRTGLFHFTRKAWYNR